MGFSRQEYWSGLPFPALGDLPDPGIQSESPGLVGGIFTAEPLEKPYGYNMSIGKSLKHYVQWKKTNANILYNFVDVTFWKSQTIAIKSISVTLLNVICQHGWERVWERMDTCLCMAESLCCSPGTTPTLLIGYTPIQNVFGVFFKKRYICGCQWSEKISCRKVPGNFANQHSVSWLWSLYGSPQLLNFSRLHMEKNRWNWYMEVIPQS